MKCKNVIGAIVAGGLMVSGAMAQDKPVVPAPAPAPTTPATPEPPASPIEAQAEPKLGVTSVDVKVGEGAKARVGSLVVVHLVGSIKGSVEIENTVITEKPVGIVLRSGLGGAPFPGLVPGISGMKVGGKRTINIPAAAAYGAKEVRVGNTTVPVNSDLVYEVELLDMMMVEELEVGTGAVCKPGTIVNAHYKGTFKSDGKEFDSSHSRGQPATFPLANVIKGWTEGVPGMRVGGKRKLTIPYQFAYGEAGRPPKIPAKSGLVFEIELIAAIDIIDEKIGEGAEVPHIGRGKPAPTVNVHYRGTLKDGGKQFDSSYDRGEPIEFPLDGVIQGRTYGIPGMKVGGKRRLIVPWQFAYGERGVGADIGPKADLIFDVELLGVR